MAQSHVAVNGIQQPRATEARNLHNSSRVGTTFRTSNISIGIHFLILHC
jgi:hypothetical protein